MTEGVVNVFFEFIDVKQAQITAFFRQRFKSSSAIFCPLFGQVVQNAELYIPVEFLTSAAERKARHPVRVQNGY